MRVRRTRPAAEALAAAFLSSDAWTESALRLHAADAFAVPSRTEWVVRAAKRAIVFFDEPPRSRFRDLVRVVEPEIDHVQPPLPRVRRFPVPALPTAGALHRGSTSPLPS